MLRACGSVLPQLGPLRAGLCAGYATAQDFSLVMRKAEVLSKEVVSAPAGELGTTFGVPLETFSRKALIYCPARTAGQQGGGNSMEHASSPVWKLVWDNTAKWVNPLMGWTSTSDPLENVGRSSLTFYTREEAVAFAKKSGWAFEVVDPQPHLLSRPKRFNAYGDNFSTRRKGVPNLSTMPSNSGKSNMTFDSALGMGSAPSAKTRAGAK